MKDAKVSINHTKKAGEEYDYTISLDPKTYIGVDASDLRFEGSASVVRGDQKEEIKFSGPINKFRLSFNIADAPANKLGT